jgi:hypothetical protein
LKKWLRPFAILIEPVLLAERVGTLSRRRTGGIAFFLLLSSCAGSGSKVEILAVANSFYTHLRASRIESARSLICQSLQADFDDESEELVRLARAFTRVNTIPRSTATQIGTVEVGVSFVARGSESHSYIPVVFDKTWKLCPDFASDLVPK